MGLFSRKSPIFSSMALIADSKAENSYFHSYIGIFVMNIENKTFYIAISQYYLQYLIDIHLYSALISAF